MTEPERSRSLHELPWRREGWEPVKVGKETLEKMDQFISTLVNFGEGLVEGKRERLPGMPASPFFVRVSIEGIENFTFSVSLPSTQEDKSSVVITDNRRSPAIKAIEMMRMGKDEIGLRAKGKNSGRRIENSEEIIEAIQGFLKADQIRVEVGRLVLLGSYSGDKTWQSLGGKTLALRPHSSRTSRKKPEIPRGEGRGRCSYCGKPGARNVSEGVYFHDHCPREVRR